MIKTEIFCPSCLKVDYEVLATTLYRCNKCGEEFSYDDYEHEELRQKISSICSAMQATEEKPIRCDSENDMELHINGIYEEVQEISEAEKPQVVSVFHDQQCVVWVRFKDPVLIATDGSIITDDGLIELDALITVSLKQILEWLEKNLDIKALGSLY